MARPRSELISLSDTANYHCVSRCVRKAYLCGIDHDTGINYEHRRQRIEKRLFKLVDIFAIELCAYAIMHNHHHEVLHVNVERANSWTWQEVVIRWHQLFKGKLLSQRFLKNEPLNKPELIELQVLAEKWRLRLTSVSWFMRALNEKIARDANEEDGCTGKFFEARFKSQALLDDKSLITCMAYVDLNPIRAELADSLESSEYTSIKQRIEAAKKGVVPTKLACFNGKQSKGEIGQGPIAFAREDYIDLVTWTGRAIHPSKRGFIPSNLPPVFTLLNISPGEWLDLALRFEVRFTNWIGGEAALQKVCAGKAIRHVHGSQYCRQVFGS